MLTNSRSSFIIHITCVATCRIVYDNWWRTSLYNVYRNVVCLAKRKYLRFSTPDGSIADSSTIAFEFSWTHHTGVCRTDPILTFYRRKEGKNSSGWLYIYFAAT